MSNGPDSSLFVRGLSWGEFSRRRPDLTDAGRELFYQFGVGLAFMSTVRTDGGPRLHPICPVLTDNGLYAYVIPSPKLNDLRRDGRFALHSFPTDSNEDAFYMTGSSLVVDSSERRAALAAQFREERSTIDFPGDVFDNQTLVEFFVERCLLTRTAGFGDLAPRHALWQVDEP